MLTERVDDLGGAELEFSNAEWRLRIAVGKRSDPYELLHLGSGRYVVDESYCYQLTVAGTTNSGYNGGPLVCRQVCGR